jgi:capsular exopolysaccharide synthesis family protein
MSLTLLPDQPAGPALRLGTPPSMADQWLVARRRWRVILATTGLVVCLTCLALAQMTPRYTASGILLYDPESTAIPGDPLAVPDQAAINEDAVTASQAAVIASLPAARELAARLNLAAVPEFNPARRGVPWPLSALPPRWLPARNADPDAAAAAARRALAVSVLPESRVITVAFTASDPALAAAAANLAMSIYLDHERAQAIGALNDAQNWIEKNAALLQAQLTQTETALAQARAAAGVVAGAQANLTTETASRLAASLVQAQADLAMNQARLSAASAGDAANAAVAPNLLPLRKEQADLTAQVQALAGQYGLAYPSLVAARTSLAAITAEINAETGREMDAARAEVAADQAEISTLQAALAAARNQSQTEDTDSAPIRALQDREDAGRDMLHNMTLQADQLAQEAALTRPDARIISEAEPPDAADGPHRSLILAASLGLGLCLGLLLAGLAEALDTSFRSGGDIRFETGLLCLAQVPEIRAPRTAVLEAPFSLFAEQIRALQTALGRCGAGAPGAGRVIAVTAARPGEGKTTLTIALARALAASGRRVVAVDGDLRQPSFDPAFGLGGVPGLTDHLAGLAGIDDIIFLDTQSTLAVIAAGGQAQAAFSLFSSAAAPQFLDELRRRYDIVLLDVPPAFALAEGRVLARLADAALLCVRWGDTPRRVVAAAIALLREAEVKLVGAALTRVDARAQRRSGFPDAEIYQPRYGGYFRETG